MYCWRKLEDKTQRLYPNDDRTNRVDNKVRLDLLYREVTINNDEYQKLNYLRKDRNAIVHNSKEEIQDWWLDKYKDANYVNEIIKIIERI